MADMLKIPKLTGFDNFHEWSSSIRDALLLTNAIDIVEGTRADPMIAFRSAAAADDKKSVDISSELAKQSLKWQEIDVKARGLIRFSVEDGIKEELDAEDCDTAHKMWQYLRSAFSTNNDVFQSKLKAELATLYMFEGSDPKEHLKTFLSLCARMRAADIPLKNDEKISTFLRTLPASYRQFKYQWRSEASKTWSGLLRAFNEEVAEEAATRQREEAATALLAGAKTRYTHGSKKTDDHKPNTCWRCGKSGHLKRNCPEMQHTNTAKLSKMNASDSKIAAPSITPIDGELLASADYGAEQFLSALTASAMHCTTEKKQYGHLDRG